MLTLLKIRNLALVDELVWELGAGLVGVTGETGAGKSVIVGALKLVLGERADKSLIRTGEDQCSVEAVFELGETKAIAAILEEGGFDPLDDNQLIIRRSIGQNSTRQFINDSPVTLNLLKRIGEHLVDLHGPHDHQSLLSTERQLAMLDAYADAAEASAAYRKAHREWREKQNAYDQLRDAEAASDQELELLRHQLEEIDGAKIKLDEQQDLEDRYRRSSNASRLVESASAAVAALSGEDGVIERIGDVQRLVRELEKLDPSIAERTSGLESAALELQELESNLTDYAEELDIDPQEATALEERINLLESLKRKYGPSLEDVMERRDQAAARLDAVENRGEKLESLKQEVDACRANVDKTGKALSTMRKKAAPKLAKEITGQLADLGFRQSNFEIQLEAEDQPTANGLESVEFQFGPNPGEPLQPLRQIASSGEISRVMLALKTALADQDHTPLMVFDEIDANVGGEIAVAVGRKMAALGMLSFILRLFSFSSTILILLRFDRNDGISSSFLYDVQHDTLRPLSSH